MSTYVIGDVHGCHEELQQLLAVIHFRPGRDRLWFLGDLVNRGPDSLKVLRLVRELGDSAELVLGNHDLHLLAVAGGVRPPGRKDNFQDVLAAAELPRLVDWLRRKPLLLDAAEFNAVLVHAGLPPHWSLPECFARAAEVELVLSSDDWLELLAGMYGDKPRKWRGGLARVERWRLITNYFTRMRHCKKGGKLELKTVTREPPEGYKPWFAHKADREGRQVLFGHWAGLAGETGSPDCLALDHGCVWGHRLAALRLSDRTLFLVPAKTCHA